MNAGCAVALLANEAGCERDRRRLHGARRRLTSTVPDCWTLAQRRREVVSSSQGIPSEAVTPVTRRRGRVRLLLAVLLAWAVILIALLVGWTAYLEHELGAPAQAFNTSDYRPTPSDALLHHAMGRDRDVTSLTLSSRYVTWTLSARVCGPRRSPASPYSGRAGRGCLTPAESRTRPAAKNRALCRKKRNSPGWTRTNNPPVDNRLSRGQATAPPLG